MSIVSPETLSAFLDASAALKASGKAPPPWLRARVVARDEGHCWHCGNEATVVGYLFSRFLGGHLCEANLAASCGACRVRMRDTDPMSQHWEKRSRRWTARKAEQRMDALALADQHAVPPKYQRSAAVCRERLEETRWQMPRVPVAVYHGPDVTLLSTPQAHPGMAWVALAQRAREAGAMSVEGAPGVLVMPSDQWEVVAWRMVEQGALLHRVNVGDPPGRHAREATASAGQLVPVRWEDLFQGVRGTSRRRNERN